jgi:hypothetical protein
VVLGEGSPLLKGLDRRLDLRLLKTRPFKSGNVLLYYEPANISEGRADGDARR